MFTVVGILAIGKVLGHQTQGSSGKCSTDEVEYQHTFDLLYNWTKAGSHLSQVQRVIVRVTTTEKSQAFVGVMNELSDHYQIISFYFSIKSDSSITFGGRQEGQKVREPMQRNATLEWVLLLVPWWSCIMGKEAARFQGSVQQRWGPLLALSTWLCHCSQFPCPGYYPSIFLPPRGWIFLCGKGHFIVILYSYTVI